MKLQGFNYVFITSCLFFLYYFSSSSSIPLTSQGLPLPYMTSNPDEISGKSFDYIVIGEGACGCPLVATLSEKYSVLLIERGGGSPYNDPMVLESTNSGRLLVETDEFSSIAQSFVSEEGVPNARGRILGGSTAINLGFYSRASDEFVKTVGWDKDLVRDAYEWVEDKIVFRPRKLSQWQSVVKDGLVEGGGLAFNGFSLEHIPGTKVSGSIFDGSGIRHSSADLLGYGNLKRITVLLNATVKNVVFHDAGVGRKPKVSGVRFIRSDGDGSGVYEAYLKQPKGTKLAGDVILSAGALGSPQILMLSGIGPREHLRQFNVTPIINAAQVGKAIKDNPGYSLLLESPDNRTPDVPKVVGITNDFKAIIESLTSYVTQNETRWTIGGKLTFPISKGELNLRNTDPRQNPSVRFNYLTKKRDLDQCVKMAHLLEKVRLSNALKPYLGNDQNPELSTTEELRESCKSNFNTFYHNHGGCGVGSVVGKNYRVYGVEGLRVVDGSTLPDSPGTNPMATLLMLGRYQGLKMLQEREDISQICLPEYGDHLLQWVSMLKKYAV